MFYATAGGAMAHVEYSAQTVGFAAGSASSVSTTSFQTNKMGWVAGAGVQWMATPNILLGAEYLFYSINGAANGSAGVSPPLAPFPLPFSYAWTRDNIQVARVTGSYKF
jgi:opacity protein-like surface antigen